MKKVVLMLACMLSITAAHAQSEKRREAGLLFRGVNNFGLTYRSGTENKLWRYSLLSGGLSSGNFSNANTEEASRAFSLGLQVGREFRKPLAEQLHVRYGADLLASVGQNKRTIDNAPLGSNDIEVTTTNWSAGVGFVLGLNYTFAKRFILGAEVIPQLTYGANRSKNQPLPSGTTTKSEGNGFDFSFNSSTALLSLVVVF